MSALAHVHSSCVAILSSEVTEPHSDVITLHMTLFNLDQWQVRRVNVAVMRYYFIETVAFSKPVTGYFRYCNSFYKH